jgi:hypothetical protein
MVGHALADYPLQGPFLATAKHPRGPVKEFPWYQAMGAHALIHGGFVFAITGSVWIGLLEVGAHFAIDVMKCVGLIGLNEDQGLHVLCKIGWCFIVFPPVGG